MRNKPHLLFSDEEQAPPEHPAKPKNAKPPFSLGGFLASPARFERAAFRLGGERSILLSYGDKYEIMCSSVKTRGKRNYTEAAA